MRLTGVFAAFLICVSITGCGFRALTDQDVAGTYEASTDWGSATLVLHPDHSFEQTVARNDDTQSNIKETWVLTFVAGKEKASSGILALKPFLWVAHDHKGNLAGGLLPRSCY